MIPRENLLRLSIAIGLVGFLAAVMGNSELALSAKTPKSEAGEKEPSILFPLESTNADISFSSPKKYVVISDHKKNIKRLYGKGSLIFKEHGWTPALIIERIEPQGVLIRQTKIDRKELLPFGKTLPGLPHLILVREVEIKEIRYEFKVVNAQPDKEPVLKLIDGTSAYLVKEIGTTSSRSDGQAYSQAAITSAAPPPSPGDLISKIQVTQLDEENYEVEKDSLRPLAKSVRRGLGNLRENFNLAFSVITPTRLEMTSSLGDATFTQQGFTITRFGNYRKEELGLRVGDRILSINDQSVTSPLSAWGVVRILLSKNKELDQLQLKLVRDNIPLTKTYRLK